MKKKLHRIAFHATLVLLAAPAPAQIKVDRSAPGHQRPTVLSTANGVPLVNIQTPSAAGVSLNRYSQFDIGPSGAVLNNSRQDAYTQIGGWVGGNPWLGGGPARVIVNQVNSQDPSRLNGPIEVAGQRAEVVVANPAGIRVNGASFINAQGVTLATGAPVLNNGTLDAFRVTGGVVSIDGLGLDLSGADHARILARAVEVNAGLWAEHLTVLTGSNQVAALASGEEAALQPITASGPAPSFMLDVAAIGGMYAQHIYLRGTERGLGVNNQGVISSQAGPLELRADGWLLNAGSLQSNADLNVQADGIHNAAGAVIVGERVSLQAPTVTNGERAVIAARQRLDIQASDTLSNQRGGLILSGADMALSADRIENRSARIEALGDLDITARVLINANEHLQTEVITDGGATTTRTLYFTPSGEVDANEVAWMAVKPISLMQGIEGWNDYVRYGRSWLFTHQSAQALASTDPVYADPRLNAWYHGPDPFVAAGMVNEGSGDNETPVWQEAQFNYGRTDPIWAALGVAAPARNADTNFPGPMPRESDFAEGKLGTIDHKRYGAALAEWQAKAQPWIDLGQRLAAVRDAINAQLQRFDVYQTVTETRPTLKTLHSEPGQILAGGNARLNVGEQLSNQDSEIIAGGALQVPGVAVNNQASEVTASLTRRGTAYVWGVTGKDCHIVVGCDPEYGWVQSAIDQRLPIQLKVSALRHEQGAADAPTAPSADLNNALFKPAASPAATYLIETDPRFTDRRQWLSSDHQLALLGVDPNSVHKRLGDGFIEQRLVREQIAQLSGQRFLGDYQDDEAQYNALLEAGATFAQAHQLRPGIALSAEQVAALTSDIVWLQAQVITLPDGSQQTVLVPKVYLKPREGDLGPQGSLIAGRSVEMDLMGELNNSGSVMGRELVLIDAQGIRSPGRIASAGTTVLRTQQDIEVVGGEVGAKDLLLLDAGRDLKVASTTAQSTDGQAQVLDRVARLSVSGEAGQLIASAGRDMELLAAGVQADVVDMHADRDLRLGTVDTRETLDATRDEKNYGRVQRSAEVGSWVSGQEVKLSADRDVQMRAAQVQANARASGDAYYEEGRNNGRLSIDAGRDLDISAGEATYQVEHGLYAKSSDILGSSSTETRRLDSHTRAQGSSLGGRNVDLSAGQDLTLKGSSAIADEDLTVQAGGDVRVLAERTEHRQERFREDKSSGLYGSGAGLTLGSQQHSSEQQASGSGAAGSTLGAIGGTVTIRAGQTYEQVGSDVLAPGGDIDVRAQRIDITEARSTEQRWQQDKMSQSGITVGVGGAVVQAMQAVAGTAEALGDTKDRRMQALGVATAGLQVQQAMGAASQAAAQPSEGVSVNIGIGASSSRSTSEGSADSAQGSRVVAGGGVSFVAEGAGQDSDILVRGSEIRAGQTVRLKAEDDVDLRAADNTVQERTESKNRSGSVGIGFQVGGTGAGFGITASASAGRGKAEGEALTHTNTHVTAGDKVIVESGNDTTLAGAVVSAERIEADIGGDLHIESLQDRLTYKERSQQAGGSATFGAGAGGSFSSSATNIESEYQSVVEQSGMRAGDGGFDIQVKGKTTLKGGVITSTQAAVEEGRNSFDSQGGLELQDVQNEARYKAKGWSVSGGTYETDQKNRDGTPVLDANGQVQKNTSNATSMGFGEDQGHAQSTTSAGISGIAGNKAARTGDAQTGIEPIFEKERVKDEVGGQVAITQNGLPVLAKGWGDVADKQRDQKKQEAERLEVNDPARAQLLAEADRWDEGGAYRAAGHALIGGVAGGAGAAASAGAASLVAPTLNDLQDQMQAALEGAGLDPSAAKGIAGLGVATGVGLAAGATGGTAAAGTAFATDLNNRQLHPTEKQRIRELAGDKAKASCRGDSACERDARVYWSDMLERVAESRVDTQAAAHEQAYQQGVIDAAGRPGSEAAMGGAERFFADLGEARKMLGADAGRPILDGQGRAVLGSDGQPQTYFSATPAQRNDPYGNVFPGGAPNNQASVIPGKERRDEQRLERLNTPNGQAVPDTTLEETLLGIRLPTRGAKLVARGAEGRGVSAISGAAGIGEGGEAAIKSAGDAAQARPPASAVQSEYLRTELDDWAKMTPDTSRDAQYIAKTDSQVLQQNNFDMDHVLTGEVNAKGKATGYHAEFAADGAARIKPGADITYNANGTYEAPVQVWDAKQGVWVDKKNMSTFFPPSWSQARIDYEVSEAFKKGTPGTSFVKPSPSGIDIQFHWDSRSQRTTFYPLKEATP